MKKGLLLFVLLCMVALGAFAQEARRFTINGNLTDIDSKEAMEHVSVQLFTVADSAFVGGTISNERGNFSVDVPSVGTFRLRISFVGYETIEREVTLRREQNLDLGNIRMAPDDRLLKEAVVSANVPQVVVKKDTLLYNPEAFRTPEGSAVEELIKRLPGADIDEDGNITINGKVVQKILVDGKEFMLGDIETALKNIPVSIIEAVKYYDQQSDQSRITGIDDGEKETVLDFSIKKGMNRGYMTNLDIAGGTEDRYAMRGTGSSFTDKTRIMLMGNANNKEENAGWWNRRGLNTNKMLGANLNYDDSKKLRVDMSVRWNHRTGNNRNENASENFYSQDYRTFSNRRSVNLTRNNNWNGNLRVEWKPDTLSNIMLRANGSYGTNDGTTTSLSATFNDDPYLYTANPLTDDAITLMNQQKLAVNRNDQANLSYGRNRNVWGMLQFYRCLNPKGRNLMFRVEGSAGDNRQKNASNNEVHLFLKQNAAGQDSTYFTARYNETPSDNKGYVLSTSYTEPLWKGAHLTANYELRYNQNKSDRQTFDFSHEEMDVFAGIVPVYREWDAWLGPNSKFAALDTPLEDFLDKNLSRYSEYKNYTHNIRLTLRHREEKFDYNVGVLLQPKRSNFIQDYRGRYVDTIRTVTNFTPTLNFRYKFSDQSNFRVQYRGDTRQPDITQLLDITDDSNPLWITQGNPGLKPQFTNSMNVYYNNFISKWKRSIVVYANYRNIRNSISNLVRYNAETGGSVSRPENINGNWNADGGFTFNTAIDTLAHWNVGTDTRVRYNNFVSYVSQSKADAKKNTTRSTNLNQRLNVSFRNSTVEVTLDGNVTYQHTRNELQPNANLDTWQFSYGGQMLIRFPLGFEFSTNLREHSRRGYNDPSMNTNELIWNGQLSKTFLKSKTLVVALNFYDLLQEQSNFDRYVGATSRSDTQYNSINSYAMLHVRYRLNMFGGKIDTEGKYDKKWGGR